MQSQAHIRCSHDSRCHTDSCFVSKAQYVTEMGNSYMGAPSMFCLYGDGKITAHVVRGFLRAVDVGDYQQNTVR
jgi:hypothetical protein